MRTTSVTAFDSDKQAVQLSDLILAECHALIRMNHW